MELYFATSNQRKIGEARAACEAFNIKIIPRKIAIDEIQSSEPQRISEHKAKAAFAILQKPLVVTDTFWSIPALHGFPGGYMKDVTAWFTPQDFLALMEHKEDKRAMFSENIVYIDQEQIKHFSAEYWGRLVPPRGIGLSIEQIAEFDGYTIGERREQGTFSHKSEEYVWYDFALWYVDQQKSVTSPSA